jgi:tRNA(adenine34) deaminase
MKFRPASGRNFSQEIGRDGRLHRVSPPRPAAPVLELLEEGGLPRDGLANHLSTTLLARGSWDARLWSSTDVWPCCVRFVAAGSHAAIIVLMRENLTPQPDPTDLRLMRRALLAAESAAEKGEVPVGAVVASGDDVLAVAANEREATGDPTAHAELLAIRRAAAALGGWRLTGCTLYSTLEPCPMCAGAAHAARLHRLVYAAPDPKAGYAGTLHDIPADDRLNHTIVVERGVLEAEAAELLRNFFKNRRERPQ